MGAFMTTAEETTEISDPAALVDKPLVSVYMLAYRHERFIARAIEGVVAQRCDFPFELIIGEDCSPDRTGEIVREYQRRYRHLVRILTSAANVGAHANGKRCRLACRGEYVAICEGDDFWHHPRKLALQVAAMQQNPEISLCHTDIDHQLGRFTLHSVNALRKPRHIAQGPDAYTSLLLEWTPTTATTMYKRNVLEAFESSRFNRADWPFGDYNKALFASVHGTIAYLPVSTATWTQNHGSATNSGFQARLRMGRALADCRECFMERYPLPPDVVVRVREVSHRRIMSDAFVAGDGELYRHSWKWLDEHGFKPSKIAHGVRLTALKLRVPSNLIQMCKKTWRLRRLRMVLHVVPQLLGIGTANSRQR
jgi:glycosyltransferase involved in cell wall biosynthesis